MSSLGFNHQEGSLSNTNSVSSRLEESLSNTIPVSSHREESLSNTILVSSNQEDSANESSTKNLRTRFTIRSILPSVVTYEHHFQFPACYVFHEAMPRNT